MDKYTKRCEQIQYTIVICTKTNKQFIITNILVDDDERVDLIKTLFSYNPFYRLPISGKSEMIEVVKEERKKIKVFSSSCVSEVC